MVNVDKSQCTLIVQNQEIFTAGVGHAKGLESRGQQAAPRSSDGERLEVSVDSFQALSRMCLLKRQDDTERSSSDRVSPEVVEEREGGTESRPGLTRQ